MPVDNKLASEYVKGLMKKLENDPDSLDNMHRRTLTKAKKAGAIIDQLNKDLSQIRDQIKQGEALLKSKELSLENEVGRHNGLLDLLVSLKFEEDEAPPDKKELDPSKPPPLESKKEQKSEEARAAS